MLHDIFFLLSLFFHTFYIFFLIYFNFKRDICLCALILMKKYYIKSFDVTLICRIEFINFILLIN